MINKDLGLAREWAEFHAHTELVMDGAASRVIHSLPDQWIDAEKVQDIAGNIGDALPAFPKEFQGKLRTWQKRLSDIPTPPLPTLAELIEAGNDPKQYQWMQCKEAHFPTGGTGAQGIILASGETSSLILERNGAAVTWNNRLVTPLPGEPKLVWPSLSVSDKSEPVSVETEDVTEESRTDLPCPEDVPAGEPWLVKCAGAGFEGEWIGTRSSNPDRNYPWMLTNPQTQEREMVRDSKITLVSRLVPEVNS